MLNGDLAAAMRRFCSGLEFLRFFLLFWG